MLMDVPAERMTSLTTPLLGRAPMAFLSSGRDLLSSVWAKTPRQLTAPPDYSVTGEGPLGPYHQEGT